MTEFFDINTIAFTLWGYSMSYLELAGVSIGGLATWLVARNNKWTWPAGVLSAVLFFFLFYQIQLYPDMFLQVFFIVTYLRGWWRWTHPQADEVVRQRELRVSRLTTRELLVWLSAGLLATLLLGTFASRLHEWFPVLFTKPSAFPYLDSFTTTMSIIATFLMIPKKLECWYLWLIIDLISAYMYYVKGVKLVSLEYLIFCYFALEGARNWTRDYRTYSHLYTKGAVQ